MTTAPNEGVSPVSRRLNENLTALMFRMGWMQKDVAPSLGISAASISRKLKGLNDWTLPEVERLAAATHVTVPELLGDLPAYDVWLPRLDSNQQPFGYARDYRSAAPTWEPAECPECGYPVTWGTCEWCREHYTDDVVVDLAAYREGRTCRDLPRLSVTSVS